MFMLVRLETPLLRLNKMAKRFSWLNTSPDVHKTMSCNKDKGRNTIHRATFSEQAQNKQRRIQPTMNLWCSSCIPFYESCATQKEIIKQRAEKMGGGANRKAIGAAHGCGDARPGPITVLVRQSPPLPGPGQTLLTKRRLFCVPTSSHAFAT